MYISAILLQEREKMALDGFSLRQVGLGQDKTSAHMAMNTEHSIKQNLGFKSVDQIASAEGEKAIKLDDENEKDKEKKKKSKKKSSKKAKIKSEDSYTLASDNLSANVKDLDFYTKFSDKLGIRMNKNTEVIELFNKETNKVVETISTSDLIKLIDKLKISSGVLVNKKI